MLPDESCPAPRCMPFYLHQLRFLLLTCSPHIGLCPCRGWMRSFYVYLWLHFLCLSAIPSPISAQAKTLNRLPPVRPLRTERALNFLFSLQRCLLSWPTLL